MNAIWQNNQKIGGTEKLRELVGQGRHKITCAIERGEMDEVIRLAKVVKDFEAALRNLEMSAKCMTAALNLDSAGLQSQGGAILRKTAPTELSNKAWGNKTRKEWVGQINLRPKGVHLHKLKGVKYQTDSGRHVGIACAREREQQPSKWFLGLPDERFDVVVLLCQPRSGILLDFVLPPDFVARIWPSLSCSNGQKKFHLARIGTNYELDPGLGLGSVNQYLSKPEILQDGNSKSSIK